MTDYKIVKLTPKEMIVHFPLRDGRKVVFDLSKGIKSVNMREMLIPFFQTKDGIRLIYRMITDYADKENVFPVCAHEIFYALDMNPSSIHTVIFDAETCWSEKKSCQAFGVKHSNYMGKDLIAVEDDLKLSFQLQESFIANNINHFQLDCTLKSWKSEGIVMLNNSLYGYGGQFKDHDAANWEDFICFFLTAISSYTKKSEKLNVVLIGSDLYCSAYSRYIIKENSSIYSFKKFDFSVVNLIMEENSGEGFQLQLLS